jgi:hypothetical protein
MNYYAGLDVGQANDYTVLVIAKRLMHWLQAWDEKGNQKFCSLYHLVHLERLKLGTPYPAQVAHVKAVLETPPLRGAVSLALDYTGCGRPVFDLFAAAKLPCPLYGITIHGGDKATRDGWQIRVPKRDLVADVQVLLQSGRVKIADALPEAKTLVTELLNFRMKIDPQTAHDSYSAWRESQHDDLVLATALALWLGESGQPDTMGVKVLKRYSLTARKESV